MEKLGYIHKDEMTYEFHLGEVAKQLGDPTDYGLTKKIKEQFFQDLSQLPDANKFLDATLAADMQREFSSADDIQRSLVKGAFGRTLYFKQGIKQANDLRKL